MTIWPLMPPIPRLRRLFLLTVDKMATMPLLLRHPLESRTLVANGTDNVFLPTNRCIILQENLWVLTASRPFLIQPNRGRRSDDEQRLDSHRIQNDIKALVATYKEDAEQMLMSLRYPGVIPSLCKQSKIGRSYLTPFTFILQP